MVIGRRWYVPWIFLAPMLVITGVFLWWPLLSTLYDSFTNTTLFSAGQFVGLHNYEQISHDSLFLTSLWHTAEYVLVCVPVMVVLPLLVAMLVNSLLPGMPVFRSAFFVPVVTSMVVAGLIWSYMFQSDGMANYVLQTLHLINAPVQWLTNSDIALFSVMVVTVWKGVGYYMVIYLAALQNVSTDLLDAAAIDGAGAFRRLVSVIVPALRPTMILVAALSSIGAITVFTEIYVMTQGGPFDSTESLVMYIYQEGIENYNIGYASAMSFVLFAFVLGFGLVARTISAARSAR